MIVWDLLAGQPYVRLYATIQAALIKAHRMCQGMDMYTPMASILKTLVQDRETRRTRNAKPGEETIYDDLHHAGSKMVFTPNLAEKRDKGRVGHEEFNTTAPANWFYSDVDAAEDLVLFPDEATLDQAGGVVPTKLVRDRDDPITKQLERSGTNWKRFIYDLDSDAESDEVEDDGVTTSLRSDARPDKLKHRQNDTQATNGQTSEVADEACACAKCQADKYAFFENWEHDSDDEEDVLYDTNDGDQETMLIAIGMDKLDPSDVEEDTEAAFMRYVDREKAKIFKKQWHEAVIDPDERARHYAVTSLLQALTAKKGTNAMSKKDRNFCLRTLLWLHTHVHEHRLVWKDMERAFAATSIFFPANSPIDLATEAAETRAQLSDNGSRAQRLRPYSRTFQSNLTVPNDFWSDVDEVCKARRQNGVLYYRDWDRILRPAVAHWFKSGVIAPAHLSYPPGDAVVTVEQEQQLDIFFDYRSYRDEWPNPANGFTAIKNPYEIDLRNRARKWRQQGRPEARFALLRIWSHSHFLPLMFGPDNRSATSFSDAVGRSWEWKFIPKDTPGSECSMQKSVELRIEPFKKQLGKQVVVKRDMLLLMGCDEEDLKRLVLGVVFAVQTVPWRTEVDLWKSFINVKLDFLDELDEIWLE